MSRELADDWSELARPEPDPAPKRVGQVSELVEDWADLGGLPAYVYRVARGYTFDSMAVWKCAVLGKVRPDWLRRSKSGFAIHYRYVECLWHGERCEGNIPPHHAEDGRRIVTNFDEFDLTLEDAIKRLTAHVKDYRERTRQSAEQYEREAENYRGYAERERQMLARIEAFNPRKVGR